MADVEAHHIRHLGRIMAAVLIIEDDPRIRASLAARLAERGHQVETADLAMHGVEAALSGTFDIVVLDLGLPDVDGADVLKMIRSVSDVAVVVATARDDETEIIKLLNAGADDYVVKPSSVDHLDARIGAVLRRRSRGTEEERVLQVGKLVVDLDGHEESIDGRRLDLQGVRAGCLPRRTPRPSRQQARAAGRGMATTVWGSRQDR